MWTILWFVYIAGWLYTTGVFWQYGIENGSEKRNFLAPLPAAIILGLLWPLFMSLMFFSKERNDANN